MHRESSSRIAFRVSVKYPLRFAVLSLIYIYVIQYPLSLLLSSESATSYDLLDWLAAYCLVIYGSILLLFFVSIGAAGRAVVTAPLKHKERKRRKRLGMLFTILLFAVFFLWSYLMVQLRIGMTIYADFDPLPFKLTGLLFYGRLFVQPLVLAYIARGYSDSTLKWPVLVLLIGLGTWVCLASGSRFAAIMFALPMFFLFKHSGRYIVFGLTALSYIAIASLSRSFYLPSIIGGELLQIYANEEYQATIMDNIWLLPFSYLVVRVMGIGELLMTLKFGAITSDFSDSVAALISYFIPLGFSFKTASIKNIYGLGDDAFGGLGLDLFSNYWVFFGGNIITFTLGLALTGWLLGRTYRLLAIAGARFSFAEANLLIFVLLFILLFEGRAHIFPALLLIAWLVSRPLAPALVASLLRGLKLTASSALRSTPNTP